jgi:hypothetical protein
MPTHDSPADELPAQWHSTLHDAARRHSRLFVLAFRMALPPGLSVPPNGPPVPEFLDALSEALGEKRLDPVYFAVREHGDTNQPPAYLVFVLLDGQRTQSATGHLAMTDTIWSRLLGMPPTGELVLPCPHTDGRAGCQIRRDRPDWDGQIERCFRWGSSLIHSHLNPTPGVSP